MSHAENDPRVRILRPGEPDPEGHSVVYWMQRAQRGRDNPALNLAIEIGNALKQPVLAFFGITPHFPGAERRHYRFLADGLAGTRDDLAAKYVPFVIRVGPPDKLIEAIAGEVKASIIIGDENPLRVGQQWRNQAAERLKVPYRAVDADVVVPSSLFPKLEFAARTIRPKIHKVWDQYLVPVPNPKAHTPWKSAAIPEGESFEVDELMAKFPVKGVAEVPGYVGGTAEASRRLKVFLKDRLPSYATERNEPTPYMTSELSAHLHYGQISPTTIAMAVKDSGTPVESVNAYLEELIVRRELAINFVARNPDYDRLKGSPDWGLKTLAKHADDVRPRLYTLKQLEAAETYDPLWNASQKEMVLTGRMHNYLRMYWVKKILEWTPDADTAFEIARELNDRYEMDGRDPNGYTGMSWGIGGRHDRPWGERPIFGMIRFMSYESTRKKFDSAGYIARVRDLE